MSTLKIVLPISAITLALAGLIWTGCGIMTAPVSVPAAIASNASFSFHGTVVDASGQPLDGVLMSQRLNHHFWTPGAGGTDTDERHLIRVNRTFSVNERGRELSLTFTRDGYYETAITFCTDDADVVRTTLGNWPNKRNFPVVMLSRAQADADLAHWNGDIDYSNYPRAHVVVLGVLGTGYTPGVVVDVQNDAGLPQGLLYLTLTKDASSASPSGEVHPADVNLPGQISLHISGPKAGFVRIEPRLGYAPMQVSDAAPAEGYAPELTINRKRLREMRTAASDRIIEAHEYFYFYADHRFGKGWIAWQQSVGKNDKNVLPTAFRYALWLQRNDDDRNLTLRRETSK